MLAAREGPIGSHYAPPLHFGCPSHSLLQCSPMADWRQIQARIRKAKASKDTAVELAELYEQTRDAMVAFELARWQEKAGEHAEAARWYTAAAERFRRSQWKSKAEAALARLRSPATASAEPRHETEVPQGAAEGDASASAHRSESGRAEFESRATMPGPFEPATEGESSASAEREPVDQSRQPDLGESPGQAAGGERQTQTARRPRRRGRRGGRNRRRAGRGVAPEAAVAPRAQAESSLIPAPVERPLPASPGPETESEPSSSAAAPPVAAWRGRSRAGEPALASRMAHLESQLRRLLACPQARLDQAESAPAGPGVLLLSDSDQVSHYYVESCQTLRIAVGNLLRGGRGAKEGPRLKERLAENLGIAESRVTNYLKEHCAVRWLQLDEGATELAHFAIAVLRPVVHD
jgi:hypothetical protein